MALTWISSGLPPRTDDKVSVSQAACAPFRATVYALEPYEDRFFYDIDHVSSVNASLSAYVVKAGFYSTAAACQREAALRLRKLITQMDATLGVVK